MLTEVRICQIQRSSASHSRVDLASGASGFLASCCRCCPAPHPLSHPKSGNLESGKESRAGGYSQRHPAENLRAESFSRGRTREGAEPARGRSCGKQPEPLPPAWPRSPRGRGFAAENQQHRLGGSLGEREQAGSHGADPNPPTVPGEQTAPPALPGPAASQREQTNSRHCSRSPSELGRCHHPTGLRALGEGWLYRWKDLGFSLGKFLCLRARPRHARPGDS